jgi:hypothetical protein
MSASNRFTLTRGQDQIQVEILEDGTIKTETDSISSANHSNADDFLKEMFRLAGGAAEIEFKRPIAVTETHHEHHHQH